MEDASVVLGIHSRHLTALQERFLAEPATVELMRGGDAARCVTTELPLHLC